MAQSAAGGVLGFFDDVQVGQELGPVEDLVTTEMVKKFCLAWGSEIPNRFTDEETARREGLPTAILPGILNMAVVGKAIEAWAPAGELRRLETLFRRPVLHNQPLRVVGTVAAKKVTDDGNQVECDLQLQSADGETLVIGSAVLILPSKA